MMSAILWLVTLAVLSAPVVFFVRQTWGLLRLNLQVGVNDDSFVRRNVRRLVERGRARDVDL